MLAALLGLCSGCIQIPLQETTSKAHHLILGIGVVSMAKGEGEDAALVTRYTALGLSATDQPGLRVGLGYASGTTVTVSDRAENVLVEASQSPTGILRVSSPQAELESKVSGP